MFYDCLLSPHKGDGRLSMHMVKGCKRKKRGGLASKMLPKSNSRPLSGTDEGDEYSSAALYTCIHRRAGTWAHGHTQVRPKGCGGQTVTSLDPKSFADVQGEHSSDGKQDENEVGRGVDDAGCEQVSRLIDAALWPDR